MPPVGFEATISAGERPQTYAIDSAATGTGNDYMMPALIRKDRYSAGQDMNSSIFWKVNY
jgi:hypothetical protein